MDPLTILIIILAVLYLAGLGTDYRQNNLIHVLLVVVLVLVLVRYLR